MNPKGYSSQTNMQPLRYLNAAALNHVQSIFAYATGYRVRQPRGCHLCWIYEIAAPWQVHRSPWRRPFDDPAGSAQAGRRRGPASAHGSSRGPRGARAAARRAANLSGTGTWRTRQCLAVPLPARHLCPAHSVSCTPFCVVTLTNPNRLWLSLSKTAASVDSSA